MDFRPPTFAAPPASAAKVAGLAKAKTILRFESASASTDRNDLKQLCSQYGEVAFVDFRFGETTGYIRFRNPDGASAALSALSSDGHEIAGATPSWSALSDEQAEQYMKAATKKKEPAAAGSAPRAAYGGTQRPAGEKGVVLRFEGVDPKTERSELSTLCAHYGDVAYVDFKYGETSGHVRFRSSMGCKTAFGQLSSGSAPPINGVVPTWRLLSEEEEEAYREAVVTKKRGRAEMSGGGGGSSADHAPPPQYEQQQSGAAESDQSELSAVLSLSGTGIDASRESVSAACSAHAEVAFVDFRPGATSGYVRFRSADGARAACAGMEGVDIGGKVPSWSQLTIAEAKQYRQEAEAAKRQRFLEGGGGGGGGGRGRGGLGGGGFGRGRGRGRIAL